MIVLTKGSFLITLGNRFSSSTGPRLLCAVVLVLLVGCANTSNGDGSPATERNGLFSGLWNREEETGTKTIPYTVNFADSPETELVEIMRGASRLIALADRVPRAMDGIQRRAKEDEERLTQVLRSQGHYAGKITTSIKRTDDGAEVTVAVDPGPVYLIGDVVMDFGDAPPPQELRPSLDDLGVHIGDYAKADIVIAVEDRLIAYYSERGYPEARAAKRRVTVDHADQTMKVTYFPRPGPSVTYGQTRFEGSDTVHAQYLEKLIPWQIGEPYRESEVEGFRRRLRETGLFGAVAVDIEDVEADEIGHVAQAPVLVTVMDAAQRSVGAGADYSTSKGPGVKTFWEHRNLFGGAETIRVSASANPIEQALAADFRKPEYIVRDQDLVSRAAISREDSDAFESTGIDARLGLERRTHEIWKTGIFGSFEVSDVRTDDDQQVFKLAGMPVFVERDSTDSLLDPTEGTRLGLFATPYAGFGDHSLRFGVLETRASGYVSLDDDRDVVLAARARIGSIVGENRSDLPANKRFYAGGGGSVRGYGFRLAGPVDSDNDPEGGQSVAEIGAELRLKVSESVGLVPFVDGGSAQVGLLPTSIGDLLWAGGLGVRYFTPIGPVRLDVAVPLDRRRDVDDPFQLYVSIGQAF